MKLIHLLVLCLVSLALNACVTDKHAYNQQPQKIINAVVAKYPSDKNSFVFIDAPKGFIAPRLAIEAVDKEIDNGKVVAINSALALKTATVIVAGENELLTSTTIIKALKLNKDKINGAKVVVIGAKETRQALTDAAAYSNVAIEFIDTPI